MNKIEASVAFSEKFNGTNLLQNAIVYFFLANCFKTPAPTLRLTS